MSSRVGDEDSVAVDSIPRAWCGVVQRSVEGGAGPIHPVLQVAEQYVYARVMHRAAFGVVEQVLLGHVSHVGTLLVFGQQVAVGLVLARAQVLGDGQPPLLAVGELGVDVEGIGKRRWISAYPAS